MNGIIASDGWRRVAALRAGSVGGGRSRLFASRALAALAALFALSFSISPAHAIDEDGARSLVEKTAAEIISIASGDGTIGQKSAALQGVLDKRADVDRIARYTVGAKWRQMSAAQQSGYRKAVVPYIATRFARGFTDFKGGSHTIKRIAAVTRGKEDRVVVQAVGKRNNGGPATDLEWEIAERNGAPAVLDIKLENLSLVLQQRQEILGILNSVGGDFDKLISKLNAASPT